MDNQSFRLGDRCRVVDVNKGSRNRLRAIFDMSNQEVVAITIEYPSDRNETEAESGLLSQLKEVFGEGMPYREAEGNSALKGDVWIWRYPDVNRVIAFITFANGGSRLRIGNTTPRGVESGPLGFDVPDLPASLSRHRRCWSGALADSSAEMMRVNDRRNTTEPSVARERAATSDLKSMSHALAA